jgi:hypothetical protein
MAVVLDTPSLAAAPTYIQPGVASFSIEPASSKNFPYRLGNQCV